MEPEQKSNGAMFGIVIVIIILLIGGYYIWQKSVKERNKMENANIADTTGGSATTETGELEAELENLDIESIDSGI